MNAFVAALDPVFEWILQASWQAAVLAILVLGVQWTFRHRLSPTWRYGLWMLVVVRLLVPVPPQSAVSIFNLTRLSPGEPAAPPPPAIDAPAIEQRASDFEGLGASDSVRTGEPMVSQSRAETRGPVPANPHIVATRVDTPSTSAATGSSSPVRWFAIASLVWLAGAGLLLLRLVWAQSVLRTRLASHAPVKDPRLRQLIAESAAGMSVRESITVVETKLVQSPAVCGLWRKWLLLPTSFASRFSDAELRHVLLHEFAHLKRRDLEVHWLMTILQSLHWFNPAVWFAFARIRADRELATDTLALARVSASDNLSYGETILKVVEGITRSAARPGMVGIAESKAQLKERLREITRAGRATTWRWAAIGLMGVLAGVGLTDAQDAPRRTVPALAARIESDAATLRQESVEQSLERLAEINAFSLPIKSIGVDGGFPLSPDSDHETIEQILSNPSFCKALADLARLDKHTASRLVSTQLSLAVAQYLPLYEANMTFLEKAPNTYSGPAVWGQTDLRFPGIKLPEGATRLTPDAVEGLRSHPRFADLPESVISNLVNLPVLHISNSIGVTFTNGQLITMSGARQKVLSLVWLCGLLEFHELNGQVRGVADLALAQRDKLYAATSLNPNARERLLVVGSLYNRQVLGFALYGTADDSSRRAAALEKSKLEIQSRNVAPYDALSGLRKPESTKGEITVKYFSPTTDTVFDSFMEDLGLNE